MWNKQEYCEQLQNHVRIDNFRGESREITRPSKSSYFFMVLWHGWSCKEVCGTILWVDEQKDSTTLCGEVQHEAFSQPTQPKPKPNCDRSGKPEYTEDVCAKVKRPVPTRSMKKIFTENLFLHIDRGYLIICLKTPVLSKDTMEQDNLMSETARMHTQWKNKIVTLRYSTRKTSSTVQSTRRTLTWTFQEYHILQCNNQMTSTFRIWFRRSRTTLSDKHFTVIFNNIDNSIFSVKIHKMCLKQLETLNCVNYSMWNPKHSAKYVCRTGTSALSTCTCGHFLRDGSDENKKFVKHTIDLFSIPGYDIRKGRPHGHRNGKKVIKNITLRINSKTSVRNDNSWAFTRSNHSWCMIQKDHDRIGSHWRSDSRDGQISERGPHTHCYRRRTQRLP